MRLALVLAVWAGCNHLVTDMSNDLPDLSAAADLAGGPCPGLDILFERGSCTPNLGAGWLGHLCYPDHFTYCACLGGMWSCCGDAPPECPPSAPDNGEYCCPGAEASTLACDFAGDGAPVVHC